MRGRDDEALASTLDDEAASATSGDDACCQRLENHGFLLLQREATRPSDLEASICPRPPARAQPDYRRPWPPRDRGDDDSVRVLRLRTASGLLRRRASQPVRRSPQVR